MIALLPGEIIVDSFAGGEMRTCAKCSASFPKFVNQRYCSVDCRNAAHAERWYKDPSRSCRTCGKVFIRIGRGDGNRFHCTPECAQESARRARREFKKRRPEREPVYRERQKAKRLRDTRLERLWRKYPLLPRSCEACGEARVLDVAHRPEHARRGAWAGASNTDDTKVWVLCPTCHALLDRLGYSADRLGIRARGGNSVCPDVAEALVRANVAAKPVMRRAKPLRDAPLLVAAE